MDGRALVSTDEGIDFKHIIAWVATLGLGVLGALLGGCVGWFSGAGVATIIGASIGFGAMFLCGFCVLGPAGAIVDKAYADYAPPDATRVGTLGLTQTFSMHVTVHGIRNTINTEGIMSFFGKKNDSFIQIRCGRQISEDSDFYPGANPPKRTCVSQTGTFEETFNIMVHPTDNILNVDLYDQDMIGDDLVGTARIEITPEVLQGGFPQKQGFKLFKEEGLVFGATAKKTGTVILSFSPGDGFPAKSKAIIKEQAPLGWKRMEEAHNATLAEAQQAYGKTSYGTLIRNASLMTKAPLEHIGTGPMMNAGTGSATQLDGPGGDTRV